MDSKIIIQLNKLMQLENTMLIVYNAELTNINTVHQIHNTTSLQERIIWKTTELINNLCKCT